MNYKDAEVHLRSMELRKTVGDRKRLARRLSTAVLAVVAIRSLRRGKRATGALAAAGAVALGLRARSESGGLTEELDFGVIGEDADATTEEPKLRCAACGEPIVPGQSRGPNEDDEIVHDACMEA